MSEQERSDHDELGAAPADEPDASETPGAELDQVVASEKSETSVPTPSEQSAQPLSGPDLGTPPAAPPPPSGLLVPPPGLPSPPGVMPPAGFMPPRGAVPPPGAVGARPPTVQGPPPGMMPPPGTMPPPGAMPPPGWMPPRVAPPGAMPMPGAMAPPGANQRPPFGPPGLADAAPMPRPGGQPMAPGTMPPQGVPGSAARPGTAVAPLRPPQRVVRIKVEPLPGPTDEQATALERTSDARLARVHLRGGLLPLARAALEQMAGAGTLDAEAMADLAEVRWRSGDTEGAGEAARAHEASGGDEPLALLIVAEDLARSGDEQAADGYARAVSDRVGGAVEMLFAGQPRSPMWPDPDTAWMAIGATDAGRWGLLVGGSEVVAPTPQTWLVADLQPSPVEPTQAEPAAPMPSGRGGIQRPAGQSSTTDIVMSGRLAGLELEYVDQALAQGLVVPASERLGVLLRLDPALAPIILSAADKAVASAAPGSAGLAAIHLVRGDAYRLLGREAEAAVAYQSAHQALLPGSTMEGRA